MSDVYKDITLLIPTYNRYPLLLRALKCYQSYGPVCRIIILDSSTDTLDKDLFKDFLNSPHYQFIQYDAQIHPLTKLYQGAKEVNTPYAVLCSDDDFLVLPSLVPGVKFLNEHPDYSLVHGNSFTFRVDPKNPGIAAIAVYPQRSVEDATARQRLLNHMTDFTSSFYSIHRTQDLKRNLGLQDSCQFGWQLQELALSALSLIQGKTHKIKNIYMFRDSNALYNGSWDVRLKEKDFFDLVVSKDFEGRAQLFRDCLAKELVKIDGIAYEDAQVIAKQALWLYLKAALELKYKQKYLRGQGQGSMKSRIKAKIKNQKNIYGYVKKMDDFVSRYNEQSLLGLLRSKSPDHKNFMPIYESLRESETIRLSQTGDSGTIENNLSNAISQ